MKLNFEWDEEKARTNLKKHRVSFDETIAERRPPPSEGNMKKSKISKHTFNQGEMLSEYFDNVRLATEPHRSTQKKQNLL